MLLIADSGSTKTDWRLVDDTGVSVASIVTEGLNPYFLPQERIAAIVREKILPLATRIDKVFFYGAGCGSAVKADQVRIAIDTTLNMRLPTEVSGDILGAARSLLQDKQGIACILGTGANSCLYDGQKITNIRPSLGYMFSDWGSGTVMCKDLIALLLQERLPASMLDDFKNTYKLERTEILDQIYNKPLPNRFLASFTPFLLNYAELPECESIIVGNFRKFFEYYVCPYQKKDGVTRLSFTGSIAFRFRDYLTRAANDFGFTIQHVVQRPMDGLVRYHCLTVPLGNPVQSSP
ncbi:N-acetylglucosamine kinase [Chryseolinea sp. T2]|uniref:N-acetylglucosamine kinase n=1 Tax=Chryseolinea sp. T2 TaxID=3129255 RepID=UPI003077B14E